MSDYLLDTGVLIKALRRQTAALDLIERLSQDGGLNISVVTRVELLSNMHPHEEDATMALLDAMVTLDVNTSVADQAGRWVYALARQGIQLSIPDSLIASTAASHRLTLVTTNPRHFSWPQLALEVQAI